MALTTTGLALDVKAQAIAKLDEREIEFLRDMLADTEVKGIEDADLDTLREAYAENHDDIWLDGGLADDNERHSADDYYQGYVAGATMVLEALHAVFGITPEEDAA